MRQERSAGLWKNSYRIVAENDWKFDFNRGKYYNNQLSLKEYIFKEKRLET